MISAPNHQQLLSGNKILLIVVFGLLISSCSPKLQPKSTPTPVTPEKQQEQAVAEPEVKKFKEATISLLLPFKLNQINVKAPTKAEVEKAALAIEFYQGFMLGIDSAASTGINFKVNVLDTRDYNAQIETYLKSPELVQSNLLVGPVYPDGQKYISKFSIANKLPIVSPLAASLPQEFNNPNLISVVNNIHLHVQKIGDHISRNYNSENNVVVLINPKSADDEVFGGPIRRYFSTLKNKKFSFQEYASVFSMEMKVQKNKRYVILLSSSNKTFVTASIDKLLKMQRAGLSVSLYGHPNWTKQTYPAEKLQALNTIVSSSYKIDYRRPAVINFVKKYRAAYQFEPSEYAFKGYDIGLFFGGLIARSGPDFLKQITKHNYRGLHNSFHFVHDEQFGYINTSLMLLQYKNFALNTIE
jgi:ABC-type branched-subunit amino acid transport system substrate-binding protein